MAAFTRNLFTVGLMIGILCGWIQQPSFADKQWVVYEGKEGQTGNGKHIVLISGDEEYRSEEFIPQLGKILAVRHGFKCTVLFAIDREDGTINPEQLDNIPGLEALENADLMVLFVRFRELPDEQMKHIVDYINSGKPIMALRTSTHAFRYVKDKDSPYAKYDWHAKEFEDGFGKQVLGQTWIRHHGAHQKESTRGIIAEGMEDHPIVNGCEDIWGPSDVYKVLPLHGDCKPLVMGQVLKGMNPNDEPNPDKNMEPIAWLKTYKGEKGKTTQVFTTTMGHGGDLKNEGFRRLLVNACYWLVGMEEKIPERADVELVGEYDPNPIGVGKHKKGLKPEDFELEQ